MFHVYMSLFIAVLFYVLTPGILLTLPKGGSKMMVAATHAVVFALVFHFTHKMAWKAFEGFLGTNAGGTGSGGTLNTGSKGGNAAGPLRTSASSSSR